MNAMRMEKAFKRAGELTKEVTLPEAGVMRFVRLDTDYLGAEATRASAASDLEWVCTYLEIEPDGVEDGHGGGAVLLEQKKCRFHCLCRVWAYSRQDFGVCLSQATGCSPGNAA